MKESKRETAVIWKGGSNKKIETSPIVAKALTVSG
jgi:hypothetical protein